jgi:transposase InsO family protein
MEPGNPGMNTGPGVIRARRKIPVLIRIPIFTVTALALRQAIWRKEDARWKVCGIPEVLYTDNGSDFTSRHLEQVSADLKIRLVFSTPGSRGVEAASSASFQRSTRCFCARSRDSNLPEEKSVHPATIYRLAAIRREG